MADLITQSAYAVKRGVTPQYINKLVKQGVIVLRDGKVDPGQADRAIEERSDPARAEFRRGRPAQDDPPSQYHKAKTAREHYKAAITKLEYEELVEKLISAEEVAEAADKCARQIKEAMLNIPPRESAILAAESDPFKVEQILTKAINEALGGLTNGR